ncbi:MAG: methyltransferase domain-containing protein [Chloroflexi bacterium]|nr:methyltransferase domain-containing protein [Chloroflexota bacterium]
MSNFLDDTRASYDALASEYAERIFDELKGKPLDRALLDRFAEMVQPLGVAVDMGCGPGQIARFLHERGVRVIGVDLSPQMVATARALNPEIEFQTGNMLALENIPDGAWGGIAAFYSIIHIPRAQIVDALRELKRVLAPRGVLFLAFHRGDETIHPEEMWGKKVNMDFHFWSRDAMEQHLREAGFEMLDVIERAPYAPDVEHQSHRVYMFARKM